MLLQPIQYTLAVFVDSRLPNIYHVLAGLVGSSEHEIDPALRKVITTFALVEFGARDFICNPCPIGKCAFDTTAWVAVHKE
jgi:hypothetical protein